MIAIVLADERHLHAWAELRAALWPDEDVAKHMQGAADALERPQDLVAYVALDEGGTEIGFAEGSLRRDYVNGCETSPVAFLEGIYVHERFRRRGVGRELANAVGGWGRRMGCREFASDALIGNAGSRRFHAALGFVETEEVVYFRQRLRD